MIGLTNRVRRKGKQAQPMGRDPDRRSYMISHIVPVEIQVGG